MTPYYDEGGITIYHADCRDVLPSIAAADLVLTDPPYGMKWDGKVTAGANGHSPGQRSSNYGRTIINDDRPFDPSSLLSYGEHQVVWGWNHFADKLPRGTCLVWLKRYDEAFGSFLSDAEVAWMSKGHGVYCRRDLSNAAIANERAHPTQKPVSLMLWCLSFFPAAASVLDPYMGSGSTLVAAKMQGIRATGIEIEERYCEIAARRLSQEVLDLEWAL